MFIMQSRGLMSKRTYFQKNKEEWVEERTCNAKSVFVGNFGEIILNTQYTR